MATVNDVRIVEFSRADALQWREGMIDTYREAFRPPPYAKGESVVRQFQSTFERHVEREGYRCVAALFAGGAQIAGFGYGYTSAPGQWWHDQVVAQLDGDTVERWFRDAFEIVELAVRPEMQGQGIGGRLHDQLLAPVPHSKAVLSTLDEETAGLHLYEKRGWQTIRSAFRFNGVRELYRIMGLQLAGQRSG